MTRLIHKTSKEKAEAANKESALSSALSKKQPTLLKFLKIQQHQDDLLKWMTGDSDEMLQFVR